MLSHGIICTSTSPWFLLVVRVRKGDGTVRFCVDYRRLNQVTKADVYPLLRLDDALDCLGGCRYFSTLDNRSGYWQVPINPADAENTAFVTSGSLYHFNRLHFRMTNATATFPRLMDRLLGHLGQSRQFNCVGSYFRRTLSSSPRRPPHPCKCRSHDEPQEMLFRVSRNELYRPCHRQ